MLRTVICDSEEENIKNFKTFIKANASDIRVVKTMTVNEQTQKTLKLSNADLLLADIRFFGVGSFKILKDIHTEMPDLMIILYGTFNETDYMEKAMENGVISFMYKPVKPGDLLLCLEKAKDRFERVALKRRDKEQILNQYDKYLPVFMDRFLISLIHGHAISEHETLESMRYFSIDLKPQYGVMLIQIDHFKQIALVNDEKEKHLLIQSILQRSNELINSNKKLRQGVCFLHHFNSVCIIYGGCSAFEDIIEMGTKIKDEIYKEYAISVTIGLGKAYDNVLDISVSYRQAKSALRYEFFMGNQTIIPIQYVEPDNDITYRYPKKKEELLVFEAVIGDVNTALSRIDEIYNALLNSGKLPDGLLAKIALDIVVSISRYASEKNIEFEEAYRKHVSMKEINQITELDKWRSFMKKMIAEFCNEFAAKRNGQDGAIYNELKKYAEKNYFENVSLSKLALKVNCTPEYINKIFIERERKSYFDTVVEIRIEKAKQFMANEELQDENIASLIGYDDVKYYRSVFFQQTGMTTQEYRQRG